MLVSNVVAKASVTAFSLAGHSVTNLRVTLTEECHFKKLVEKEMIELEQWSPSWGTCSPRGMNQDL